MTEEQINSKIGEICGVSRDYYHDLNACHEMEKTISFNLIPVYWFALYDVTKSRNWPFDASAPHRCEAFLRLHNKWDEK